MNQIARKMSTLDIVPTRAMLLQKEQAETQFKAVIHESHKAKQRGPKAAAPKRAAGDKDDDEPDMKRMKNEVFNFGISGYTFQDRQKAKIALAVKLGAKPPKNEYKNYKALQAENKQAKQTAAEDAYIRTVGKNSAGQATVSCNKLVNRFVKKQKNTKNTVGELTKHYGVVNPRIHRKKRK